MDAIKNIAEHPNIGIPTQPLQASRLQQQTK
jgi:hypothetical protein